MKECKFSLFSDTAVFRPWRRDKRSLKDDENTVAAEEIEKNVEGDNGGEIWTDQGGVLWLHPL